MIEQHARAAGFTGLVANYERYRIGYSSELFDALQALGFRRGASVLDVGCGTGISLGPLAARGMKVTGIDISAEMLAAAKLAVPGAILCEGRAEALPFADGSFDAALSAQAFHWFDAEAAFAELIRVVKPGAPVAIWWKILGSDDPMRALRTAAAQLAGVKPVADPLSRGFNAFYRAPFAARALRVLPFIARFSVEDWIGYERSRALARNAYGSALDAYIDALQSELMAKYGAPAERISVRYSQYVYVGTTPG